MKKIVSLPIISLLCLFVFTGCNNELQDIHSPIYEVKEVTYQNGMYSFTITAGENSPLYAITEDMQLSSQKEYGELDEWTNLGKLKKIELTKDNFDDLFHDDGWQEGQSANRIRRNNANVWQLVYNQEHLYYVLQQKSGDLYLACGYYDYSEKNDVYSDDTHIRWLFKLEAGAISNVGGADGPTNTVVETIEGNLKTYSKMADGTWQYDGHTYKHRLVITGRQPSAVKDTTYVYLSNIEEISFQKAMMASGLSSNTEDYFDIEEAVLVEIE